VDTLILNERQVNGLDLPSDFADLVIEYRAYARYSQQEVADGVGVARSTEIRWERGLVMPSITNIRNLAGFLNIPEQRLRPFLAYYKRKRQTVAR
jgi:transcriptional regulator with XRE-family HTH domain